MAAADLIPLVAPQYVGDADLALAIAQASLEGDSECFGVLWPRYVALMAAHMLCLRDRASESSTSGVVASGPVTSVSNLSVSIGWGSSSSAATTDADAALMSTPYGAEALRLRRKVPCGMPSWVR